MKQKSAYPGIIESFRLSIDRNMEALKLVLEAGGKETSKEASQLEKKKPTKAFRVFVLNMMAKLLVKARKWNQVGPQFPEVAKGFDFNFKRETDVGGRKIHQKQNSTLWEVSLKEKLGKSEQICQNTSCVLTLRVLVQF